MAKEIPSGVGKDGELERSISVAVVKADYSPAIDSVLAAVNTAAAVIALKNAVAGAAVQSTAILGGWVWNRYKFDRVKPVLLDIQKRIQSVEAEYVRREEFADLLQDALRRLGDQPDPERGNWIRNALLRILDEPKDHTENRRYLRLADELSTAAQKVLTVLPVPVTQPGDVIPGPKENLRRRADLSPDEIAEAIDELVREGLIDWERPGTATPAKNGYWNLLTRRGGDFLKYRNG